MFLGQNEAKMINYLHFSTDFVKYFSHAHSSKMFLTFSYVMTFLGVSVVNRDWSWPQGNILT